uniref:trypsin n=1 Tax=Sinocyclocheilus rhinocerous TaxID=307959 RepID=A0A673GW58_9TELE
MFWTGFVTFALILKPRREHLLQTSSQTHLALSEPVLLNPESFRSCLDLMPFLCVVHFSYHVSYIHHNTHTCSNTNRNPDYSRRAWCYVRTASRLMKEDCDIPRCAKDNGWQCGQREERNMKVVGGALSAVERHPWMAAVFSRSARGRAFTCGGSLISPCWVLTAAHCFPDGSTSIHKLSVFVGRNAINETDAQREQEFRVSELFIHEHFDNTDGNYNHDIALLKIRSPDGRCAKESSSVKTVCIPEAHQSLSVGTSCEVTGYGREQEGLWYYSQYLREAKVNLLSQDVCSSKAYYGNMITDNMLCAGSPDWSADACKGDSGGPLVCRVRDRVFLFGVVSWGEGCSRQFRPGVYTKVSNYYNWILEKTGLSSYNSSSKDFLYEKYL